MKATIKILLILSITTISFENLLSQNLSYELHAKTNYVLPFVKNIHQKPQPLTPGTGFSQSVIRQNYEAKLEGNVGFSFGGLVNYQHSERVIFYSGIDYSMVRYKTIITKKIPDGNPYLDGFNGTGVYNIEPTPVGPTVTPIIYEISDPGIKTNLGFINMPLGVKLKSKSNIYLDLGCSFNYLVSLREKERKADLIPVYDGYQFVRYEIIEYDEINRDKSELRSFNVTSKLGLGFYFDEKNQIELNYNRTFFNIYKDNNIDQFNTVGLNLNYLQLSFKREL